MKRIGIGTVSWLAAVGLLGLVACDRGPDESSASTARNQVAVRVHKPEYAFAAGLEDTYPEVTAFLRHFMETALAGDYAAYRRLVARVADPESRTRFERILNSLQSLTIEEIEAIDLSRHGLATGYLVTSRVQLLPRPQVALRRGDRSHIAILVFEEEGELRMMPAPPELQPPGGDVEPSEPPPPASAPSYPWDEDGNY